MLTYFNSFEQLEEKVKHLDNATEKPIFLKNPEGEIQRWKAIWNIQKERIECIPKKRYKIIQHTEAFKPLLTALTKLNLRIQGRIIDYGGKVYLDIIFSDTTLIQQNDETVLLGIRAVNSYDSSHALEIQAIGYEAHTNYLFSRYYVFGDLIGKIRKIHVGKANAEFLFEKLILNMFEKGKEFSEYAKTTMTIIVKDYLSELLSKLENDYKFGKRATQKIINIVKEKETPSKWDVYLAIASVINGQRGSESTKELQWRKAQRFIKEFKIEVGE